MIETNTNKQKNMSIVSGVRVAWLFPLPATEIQQLKLMTVTYRTSAQGVFKGFLANMLNTGDLSLHSERNWPLVNVETKRIVRVIS